MPTLIIYYEIYVFLLSLSPTYRDGRPIPPLQKSGDFKVTRQAPCNFLVCFVSCNGHTYVRTDGRTDGRTLCVKVMTS